MTTVAGACPVRARKWDSAHPARPAASGAASGEQAEVTLKYTWLNSCPAMNASADPAAAPASNASARPASRWGRRPGIDVIPERSHDRTAHR
jgi:hypothetical protein